MTPASCLVSESEPSLTGFRYSGRNLAEKSSVLQIFRSIDTSRSLKARVNGSDRASLVMGRVVSALFRRSGRCQPQGGTLGIPTRAGDGCLLQESRTSAPGARRIIAGQGAAPKTRKRLFQFGAPLKKTQVQSAARQRDHVGRVGTELKMVFRLKI